MGLFLRFTFISLVAVVTAQRSYGSSGQSSGGSPGAGSPGSGSGSYSGSGSSSSSNSYGGSASSGHGAYPVSSGYSDPFSLVRQAITAGHPLDLLDKLWERVNDVTTQNKFAAEETDALEARMSLLKKFVDELELVTFPSLHQTDVNHNADLNRTEKHLANLSRSLDLLLNATVWLERETDKGSDDILNLQRLVDLAKRQDTRQDGRVSSLHVAATDFKAKLFTVMGNEFELFSDKVEITAGTLASTKSIELSRMCEQGSVTLSSDDRRAEYIFQSQFDDVPSVLYSITGLSFNLDARIDPVHYGYGPPPTEPDAAGVLVKAYTTRASVTFEGVDLSFADTESITVDVDFLACSIGPDVRRTPLHNTTTTTRSTTTTTRSTTTRTTTTTARNITPMTTD